MGGRRGNRNKPNRGGGAAVSSPSSSTPPPPSTTTTKAEEEAETTAVVPAGRSRSRGRGRTHACYPGVDRLVVVAGTYDGVLVGWDTRRADKKVGGDDDGGGGRQEDDGDDDGRLRMTFAVSDAHEGSVRSLSVSGRSGDDAGAGPGPGPGLLVSAGYDEFLRCYDLSKNREAGEARTPPDLGTPLCAALAPPRSSPTHCLVGLTSGKIVLYSVKDWAVVHVLGGHSGPGGRVGGGVTALACHPTGRLALSGGTDGTVRLWDLTRGRLAYVHRVDADPTPTPTPTDVGARDGEGPRPKRSARNSRPAEVSCIVFSPEDGDGSVFAFSHGKKVTARDTLTGETLLDVELPSRPNEICFLRLGDGDAAGGGGGGGQRFLACACDDGSLPVLAVGVLDEDQGEGEKANAIRAVMAIEPVDRVDGSGGGAGDERFKCIKSVGGGNGCLAVTANSGGIVSVVDLSGAARMMMTTRGPGGAAEDGDGRVEESSSGDEDDDDEEEAAAEILESVRVGSGARITDLAVWGGGGGRDDDDDDKDHAGHVVGGAVVTTGGEGDGRLVESSGGGSAAARPRGDRRGKRGENVVELDKEAVARARRLVEQAKKKQRRQKEKKREKDNAEPQGHGKSKKKQRGNK